MKNLLLVLISTISISSFGQALEVFGGLNNNLFQTHTDQTPHNNSSFEPANGYSFGVTVDSITADWMVLRFMLRFDKYAGDVEARSGGQGGGFITNISNDKSTLTLGFYPFNFRFFKKIEWSFGLEVSYLLAESFSGDYTSYVLNDSYTFGDISEIYSKYNSNIYFGLSTRIAYDFYMSETASIAPQYSFYYGLSEEFVKMPGDTKSMRHFVGLGFKKELKN